MRPPLPVSNADKARRAAALLQGGDLKQAERLLKDVLRAEPDQFDALVAYGVLCGMRGANGDAVKHLSRAVRKRPQSDAALYNLGQALTQLGRHAEAVDAFERAAALVDRAVVHEKLGDALKLLGRHEQAAASYSRAVAADPRPRAMLLSSVVEAKRKICDWVGLELLEARLTDAVAGGDPAEPLAMAYVSDDPALLMRNASQYWREYLPGVMPAAAPQRPFVHRPRQRQRPRVGYLCSDFRRHATSHLMVELIERHDRAAVEVVGLSYGRDDGSDIRKRIAGAFERFVDLSGRNSAEIARRIHAEEIDILVDLNGYIANARPEVWAARPAPVQCHWLAFPGTLGSPAIDYLIVDPVIAPPGADQHFSEKLVRLPDCYQPNDRKRPVATAAPSRADVGLPERGLVLASFNNAIKLSPGVFDVWMRLLAAVPESVLWLFADNESVPGRLRERATAAGIDTQRLVFAGYVDPATHLARLALADLFLDTWPYNAHTTASDALWVGLPVLTLQGRSFASRVGASILHAAGVPELVTTSIADYEAAALALARAPERLGTLRQRLFASRESCRLFDTDRLARHLDAAYATMWECWCRGDSPAAFDVAG